MGAYMKINGMNGNVSANGLQDNIELSTVHFSVHRKMNTKPGAISDRQGTKPSLSEVTVTKEVDKASPLLFKDATVGTPIPTVEIQFVNSGKDTNVYHTVTLSNVLISGYELHHNDAQTTGEESANIKPKEKITFNYTKLEVKNTPYDHSNKAQSPVASGYNLETAQPA